jgi:coenzyme F420-reducing hydrogenase alpha subunit
VHAFEESLTILREYRPFQPSRISYEHRAGEGCAATEAPRGLIYHRYAVNDAGHIEFAKIVPPTSQNQKQIEDDLRSFLPAILQESDERVAGLCEQLVRNYDPCISCSTHFLRLHREQL